MLSGLCGDRLGSLKALEDGCGRGNRQVQGKKREVEVVPRLLSSQDQPDPAELLRENWTQRCLARSFVSSQEEEVGRCGDVE